VHYVLGLTANFLLRERAQAAVTAARREYTISGEKARIFQQVRYQLSTKHGAIQVIIMEEVSARDDTIRSVVTGLESSPPSSIPFNSVF